MPRHPLGGGARPAEHSCRPRAGGLWYPQSAGFFFARGIQAVTASVRVSQARRSETSGSHNECGMG